MPLLLAEKHRYIYWVWISYCRDTLLLALFDVLINRCLDIMLSMSNRGEEGKVVPDYSAWNVLITLPFCAMPQIQANCISYLLFLSPRWLSREMLKQHPKVLRPWLHHHSEESWNMSATPQRYWAGSTVLWLWFHNHIPLLSQYSKWFTYLHNLYQVQKCWKRNINLVQKSSKLVKGWPDAERISHGS